MWDRIRAEWPILVAIIATIAGYSSESVLLGGSRAFAAVSTIVLILIIVATAIRVSAHAEKLAEKVGDPYGTMILTLSAVLVEVLILVIMMQSENSATLGRDTIYSAVMLDINGLLGMAALLGGFKHGEQPYNDDSSRSYGVMIITAMSISMLLPEFIPASHLTAFSCFDIVAMLVLYSVFLKMQTGPHSYFFSFNYPDKRKKKKRRLSTPAMSAHAAEEAAKGSVSSNNATSSSEESSDSAEEVTSIPWSIGVLVVGVAITGVLAELMSQGMNTALAGLPIPSIIIAIIVALISASPEILTALRAALANRMQSVINIALGASLSTVVLTIPVIEAISLIQGQHIEMGLDPLQSVMLAVTLVVAAINLNDGETNAIEGMTHFVLFAAFIALSVMGL